MVWSAPPCRTARPCAWRRARRRAEQHVQPHALKERHDAAHARRLARARPASQDQQLLLRGQLHGLPLQWRILDALPALDLVDDLLRAAQLVRLVGKHGAHAYAHRSPPRTAPQIASLYVRHLLLHDASALEQIVERLFHRIRIPVEQLRRRRHELFRGRNTCPLFWLYSVRTGGPPPRYGSSVAIKSHRHLVQQGKIHAELLTAEEIRVAPPAALSSRPLHRAGKSASQDARQVVLRPETPSCDAGPPAPGSSRDQLRACW